jgi:hypothetical protein
METISEKRAEKRLRYRWPVRFKTGNNENTIAGQMVDVSSEALSFLCRADDKCPKLGDKLTAEFGVPYFNRDNSFDSVLFNRTGKVCRLDKLNERVHRVAVKLAQALFFKPGQRDIDQVPAQENLQTRTLSIIKAEEKAKSLSRALAVAEQKTRSYAESKVKAEEKLKAEIEQRYNSEAALKLQMQEKIRTCTEAKAKAQAQLKIQTKLRIDAERKAVTEAQKRERIEAQLEKQAKLYAEQIAKIKADCKKNAKLQKKSLLKKVDKFVTDRTKIF